MLPCFKTEGRLGPAETVAILAQVAAALDAAHAAGLVHRDVKPGNILVVPGVAGQHRDHVYLSDFGLTKRVTSLSGVTAQGQFIATMDYAAPEQIGSRPVDARTDVYGLGCVAYQCLTGTVPFVRDNEAALLWAHLVERPPPLSTHRSELAPLDAAVARALEKNPEDRFETCGQFVDALAAVLPAPMSTAAADSTHPWAGSDTQTSASKARPAEPPAVLTPAAAPPTEQPEQRPDEDVPDAGARLGWQRPAATGTAALSPVSRPWSPPSSYSPCPTVLIAAERQQRQLRRQRRRAATRQCQTAFASADQTLPKGQDVATQLRVHAGIMDQMGGANSVVAGRPALTARRRRGSRLPGQTRCLQTAWLRNARRTARSTRACKARIAVADQALGHASNVVTALMQHTAIMNQWDSGQLTADQAHMQGKPSLDTGLAEANALDQSDTRLSAASRELLTTGIQNTILVIYSSASRRSSRGKSQTIKSVLAKSDLELGIEWLLGQTRAEQTVGGYAATASPASEPSMVWVKPGCQRRNWSARSSLSTRVRT